MANYRLSDRFFSIISWFVVAGLVVAAASLWFSPPSGLGPVGSWLGVSGAQYFYTVLYGGEALALAAAKLLRKKNARKHVLMVVYLTGFFTSILNLTITGFSTKLIDNLVISAGAAVCWLYWKFRTEYIPVNALQEDTLELRDDLPPAS